MNTVVFLTDRQLVPATRGHRVRIRGLMQAVSELGFEVILISVPQAHLPSLNSIVKHYFPVDARPFQGGNPGAFSPTPFLEVLSNVAAALKPTAVIAEYLWMAPCLKAVPEGTVRILDAHDLMSQRTTRFVAAGRDPWVYCERQQEYELLADCDVIIAIQPEEAEAFRSLRSKVLVEWIPPVFHPFPERAAYQPSGNIIVAVGSDHPGNHGFVDFVQRAWPTIASLSDNAQLIVAGSICRKMPARIQRCELMAEVQDLRPVYEQASIVVCPIDVGTGLKIKAAEALAHARPVVGTSIAFEGFPKAAKSSWLLVDSPDEWASVCTQLLDDYPQRLRLSHLAYSYSKQHFSMNAIKSKLRRCLDFHKNDCNDSRK